jgi:hypothetical protein
MQNWSNKLSASLSKFCPNIRNLIMKFQLGWDHYSNNFYFFCCKFFLGGLARVCWPIATTPLFIYVAHFVFLGDVWI